MLALYVAIQSRLIVRLARLRNQAGQATAEYAVVLLGVAGLALLLSKWVAKTNLIGHLFEAVIQFILGKVL
jgi:uncharacterized protein DUF4244